MDTAKLMLHPARLRILQYLRLHGPTPTSELVDCLKDIPRATVYHHVKLLEEHQILRVVQENRIRGATEKVYAFREEAALEGGAASALSTAFHMGLMQEMNGYLDAGTGDCKRDRVFFETGLLYMADGEYEALLSGIAALIKPYAGRGPADGLTLRKLSIISSPPESRPEEGGGET